MRRTRTESGRKTRRLAVAALLSALALGCASPVGVNRVDRTEALRSLNRTVVSTGEPSWPTRNVLLERGLSERFDEDPVGALAELHRQLIASDLPQDVLFALAELSFGVGEEQSEPSYHWAAVVYAYALLFGQEVDWNTARFDPRARVAADVYNWALAAALAAEDGTFEPRGGRFELPFGSMDVAFDPASLRAADRELFHFVPLAELEVEGLATRYRRPGLGVPLAASTRSLDAEWAATDMVAPKLKVPLTALLRLPDVHRHLREEQPLTGQLDLHLAWDAEVVDLEGELVPLESEPTAALALTFDGVPTLEIELLGFLGRLSGLLAERPPLVSTTPYRPGHVPVVFVHGTASSALRWAELFNRLQADPVLRRHYQFWFFQYDSDNPIALSALRLRDEVRGAVERLDPQGLDPALREIVLIGHSQGGLLVKMQVIDTDDRLWNGVSRKPLEELRLSDESRDLIRRGMFVEPVPEVSRVVFISTPHRGSFLAASQLVTGLIRRLTHLPLQMTRLSADYMRNLDAAKSPFVPTAVDNMSPRHPVIQTLQDIPGDPSVQAHSIVAVDGDGPIEEGDDGVVEYTSAHIEGVASEVVVRHGHSCQGHPDTVQEVRRILHLHLAELGEPE